MKRIAIIGGGAAGLAAANGLHRRHEITVYEAGPRVGGHCDSYVLALRDGRRATVDLGVVCYYEPAYPQWRGLLDELQVPTQKCEMSLALCNEVERRCYRGRIAAPLFLSPLTLLRFSTFGHARNWIRLRRLARMLATEPGSRDVKLGAAIRQARLSRTFVDHLLFPFCHMAWGVTHRQLMGMSARTLLRYLFEHDCFTLTRRDHWRRIDGGAERYVSALSEPVRDAIRVNARVTRIQRRSGTVDVECEESGRETFDAVVMAVHSDEALALLDDPSPLEREILGAIRYQSLQCLLHTDTSLLPGDPRNWPSATHIQRRPATDDDPLPRPEIHVYVNRVQGLPAPPHYFMSLIDADRVDPAQVVATRTYRVPIPTVAAARAASRHDEINGHRGTYYCGAYWGDGLHEAAISSGLSAARKLSAAAEAPVAGQIV